MLERRHLSYSSGHQDIRTSGHLDIRTSGHLSMQSMSSRSRSWQDEAKVAVCNLCAVSFGPARWKHHCRLCGTVFCDSCSSYYMELKQIPECEVCPFPKDQWLTDPLRCCMLCKKRVLECYPDGRGGESKTVSDRN
jgi:hypothetical protein